MRKKILSSVLKWPNLYALIAMHIEILIKIENWEENDSLLNKEQPLMCWSVDAFLQRKYFTYTTIIPYRLKIDSVKEKKWIENFFCCVMLLY